jgi:CxxC motif-containing protein (DUF1111 family)
MTSKETTEARSSASAGAHGGLVPGRRRNLPRSGRPLTAATAVAVVALLGACDSGSGAEAAGDQPVVASHFAQAGIDSGQIGVDALIEHGRSLFVANFNTLDGAGRPETTGGGAPRARRSSPQNFNRISAPDANSCAGCHNLPAVGAGGDNVANVFVLAQLNPFVEFENPPGEGDGFQAHTLPTVGNERNTLGMYGAGYVELLAREMSTELQAIRAAASAQAALAGSQVVANLTTKTVSFGTIAANPDGTFDTTGVQGVDADLVIKPFHQKGVVSSLRVFTNNAMNHHHGIQTAERFGAGADPDADGVTDELSAGDVTAATVFQATLPVPARVLPTDAPSQAVVANGEALFASIGCATCHIPSLTLDSPVFTEPGPFNGSGNLRPEDVPAPLSFDLTTVAPRPQLPKQPDGSVVVPLFSDLKRHDLGPGLNNETIVQGGVPTNVWLTKKLWGFASEPPFLHHGRATLISQAILLHGGEAQAARDAYAGLTSDQQRDVVAFLKTLRIVPDGTPTAVVHEGVGATGDAPVVGGHVDHSLLATGAVTTDAIFEFGKLLFGANFNELDGQGRPGTTGTGAPRTPVAFPDNFNRISAPDANSCAGCHNAPRIGGGGDQVANVFVLGQRFPSVSFGNPPGEGDGFEAHTLSTVANERNTLGMFGAGYIELLAREMTADLQALRAQASADAALAGSSVVRALTTKGVSFGSLTAHANGAFDASAVEGVDADLVIRPFHQKGVVVSLREFTNNAMNHHHGMQSAERFGAGADADGDGVLDELTVGDVTAATLFQALLPPPGRVLPASPARRLAATRGEAKFAQIGCATCHVPSLRLNSPVFSEPNPYNPAGNLRSTDGLPTVAVDLSAAGPGPRLPVETDGSVLVPAFTDLKRHDMGVQLNNETLVQGGVPTSHFITRKLWGFANEPPYLHHGRALLVSEAILWHGGASQASRDAFAALPQSEQDDVVEFLKTLQVLPETATTLTLVGN